MNKKPLITLLIFVVVILFYPQSALAEAPSIKSKAAILMDVQTGEVIFEKNSGNKNYPASTTKILTSIIALEQGNLTDEITVGKEIDGLPQAGSFVTGKLKIGEKVTLKDLLYGMMLTSGNDAACVVAAHYGGSVDNFVTMMNQKALSLGMTGSHFTNPHGVQNENHYTTAVDLAILARYAMKNKELMQVVSTPSYTIPPNNKSAEGHELKTTNKLISTDPVDGQFNYRYATGMKTGSTKAARGCLVATALKDGVNLIVVILGDESADSDGRWKEAKELFEYGFANIVTVPLKDLKLNNKIEVNVSGISKNDAEDGKLELEMVIGDEIISGLNENIEALMKSTADIQIIPNYEQELAAPITKGEKLGTAAIKYNDTTLAIVDLIASRDVLGEVIIDPTPTSGLLRDALSPLINLDEKRNSSILGGIIVGVLALIIAAAVFIIIRKYKYRNRHIRRKSSLKRRAGSHYFYNRRR